MIKRIPFGIKLGIEYSTKSDTVFSKQFKTKFFFD